VPVSGATGSSYVVGVVDVASTLRCRVTATNRAGSAQAQSAATVAVTGGGSAPVNTALPVVSGSAVVGQSLTSSAGSWSGSPTGYAYQWLRCDGGGGNCVAIAGATSSSYLLQSADVSATVRSQVTATNQYGSTQAQSAPTAAVTGAGGPGPTWTGPWRDASYTPPTSFTKTITTASAFKNLVSAGGSLAAGDVVHVVGPLTIDGCAGCHTLILKKLAAPGAKIYLDDNVVFAGDTTIPGYAAVYVDATNISLYGGTIAGGQGGHGLQIGPVFSGDTSNVTNITWWGITIHDVGGSGIFVGGEQNRYGSWLGTSNIDVDADVSAVGQQPQLDPHTVKGTGLHALYVGGSSSDPPGIWQVANSKFSIYTHDTSQCAGDAQIGQSVTTTEFWVHAHNLTYTGTATWATGYALTLWTAAPGLYTNHDITVHDVESNTTTGPTVVDSSLGSGPVTIQYGRATNALTNPQAATYYAHNAFGTSPYVTYQNIAQS
jgi:hypothetical protein